MKNIFNGTSRRALLSRGWLLLLPMFFILGTSCPGVIPLDSDGDGFTDTEEKDSFPGSDPFDANDTQLNPIDTDGDGCSDFDETEFNLCNGDPDSDVDVPDSDGDGDPDDVERFSRPGSDPEDPTDTQANPRDTDDDGCSDFDEVAYDACDANPNTP